MTIFKSLGLYVNKTTVEKITKFEPFTMLALKINHCK